MIVPMKKITLLISAVSRQSALNKCRMLGVLHIRHIQPPQGEEIDQINQKMGDTDKVLTILESVDSEVTRKSSKADASDTVTHILETLSKLNSLKSELEEKQNLAQWFELWGDISPESVSALRKNGVFIRFYLGNHAGLKKIPGDKKIRVVKEIGSAVLLTLFSESEDERLDFKEETLPDIEPDLLRKEIRKIEKEISHLSKELKSSAAIIDRIREFRNSLKKKLEMSQALNGMGEAEGFVYLQGFCPVDNVPDLKQYAEKEGWGYVVQDPDEPAEVPTLLRNPKPIRIINPLFKFMGTFPGYEEKDISAWFLIFLSLFYAILIGDAGYGLIFLGLTFLAQKKIGRSVPSEAFKLIYVMSGATVIWGIITGTWFGYEQIADLPVFKSGVIKAIDSFAEDNSQLMMYICFIIGIIHLSLAHLINFFNLINSLRAIGEIGWICILWSIFFLISTLVIGKPMPVITLPLLGTGILLALVFSNYQKNILKGIGETSFELPLSVISSFSDLMSYLRLFAVGFASVQVASSFNNIAIGTGIDNILKGFIAAIVLLFGHSLNIVLGLMAVLVHGVRLNMLEFSGHLRQQWSGREYKPFRE
jgi:V/A-type H+-transporting ATPase subunit I